MLARVIALVAVLAVASGFWLWWKGRSGQVRAVSANDVLTADDIASPLGVHATFVQFSTPMCSQCPGTARLLTTIAAKEKGTQHVEVDASERLDLARRFNVMRTPTILVLDGRGEVRSRIDGAPSVEAARAALATVPPSNTDYAI